MRPDSPTGTARGNATRRALLDAATERFARDGYRTTSVADISRDAGVGPTTAYVHYADKEALFLAAVDADITALLHELVGAMAEVAPGSDRPAALFGGLRSVVESHPLARRLLAGLEPAITDRGRWLPGALAPARASRHPAVQPYREALADDGIPLASVACPPRLRGTSSASP